MAYGWKMDKLILDFCNGKLDEAEKHVYQEMILDNACQKRTVTPISKAQFRRALNQFSISNYKEEVDLLIYFGQMLSSLNLDLPKPSLERYSESDVINLAKIYMRRNEPNDYPYFRRLVNCQERIQFNYMAPIDFFLGKTYFLSSNNYFVLINSINGIQDTVTLLHEASHIEEYLKYGFNLSKYYAELAPITREHYSFDLLHTYADKSEVEKQRILSLNHYLSRIMKLWYGIRFIMDLRENANYWKQQMANFDAFATNVNVPYIYGLLTNELENEIGYFLSFVASLDIYSHCTAQESNIFITSYQIGARKVTSKNINRVVVYLLDILKPYQKVKK